MDGVSCCLIRVGSPDDLRPFQPWIRAELMVEANTNNSENYSTRTLISSVFREAFAQIGNVFKSQPNAKFWAGSATTGGST
jgi:hypothetical protein